MTPWEWLRPQLFWLLLALVPLGWLAWRARRKVPRMLLPGLPAGFKPRRGLRRRLSSLPLWIRLLALACLVAALARPVVRTAWNEDSIHGVDIILAFDVSTSMQIRDVKPSRIEAARTMMNQFVLSRSHDRMGVVAFAGRPMTRCPLTTDREVLRELIDSTSNLGMEDGTAIGDALLMAANRLRLSKAKSKVVVLLTDGQNNAGAVDPLSAARALAALGIRLYTIGLGTNGTFEQQFTLPDGSVRSGTVQSDLDPKILEAMAAVADGKSFLATDRQALSKAYAEIDRLERSEITSKTFWETKEKFVPWAFAALCLLLLAWSLESTWLRRTP
ncbi:MAG TPA: VWA domain-containing protein [Fibrobacteria bacterium]|nr:VWA domain-containing protein [Fibrobacteria bacterium]HOX50417.1 VWA domain-containing protein [Fibrobacteria bacterium]